MKCKGINYIAGVCFLFLALYEALNELNYRFSAYTLGTLLSIIGLILICISLFSLKPPISVVGFVLLIISLLPASIALFSKESYYFKSVIARFLYRLPAITFIIIIIILFVAVIDNKRYLYFGAAASTIFFFRLIFLLIRALLCKLGNCPCDFFGYTFHFTVVPSSFIWHFLYIVGIMLWSVTFYCLTKQKSSPIPPIHYSQDDCLLAESIIKLKDLLDSGVISQDEFEIKKNQLLNQQFKR